MLLLDRVARQSSWSSRMRGAPACAPWAQGLRKPRAIHVNDKVGVVRTEQLGLVGVNRPIAYRPFRTPACHTSNSRSRVRPEPSGIDRSDYDYERVVNGRPVAGHCGRRVAEYECVADVLGRRGDAAADVVDDGDGDGAGRIASASMSTITVVLARSMHLRSGSCPTLSHSTRSVSTVSASLGSRRP